VRGFVYIGLKDLAVDGDGDAKRCFWEVMDKGFDRTSGGARPEPLSNILTKLLPG
jgi:hypothetical protein